MKIFGERIRALRESMHYSQVEFAKVFGIGQSRVVRYEKGEASPPLELLVKIANRYDVSLDYMLGRTDHPQGKLLAQWHVLTKEKGVDIVVMGYPAR